MALLDEPDALRKKWEPGVAQGEIAEKEKNC